MLFSFILYTFSVTVGLGLIAYIVLSIRPEGHSRSYVQCRLDRFGYRYNFFYVLATIILDKGTLALLFHRLSTKLKSKLLGKVITRITEFLTGIEIYHNVKIGKRVEIWHGNGVILGQSAEIGDNCIILQQVTVGSGFVVVGDNVKIGAGAKVLGNISLGEHTVVAANTVVTKSVNGYALVAGIPGKEVKTIESSDDVVFGTKSE